ncbi:TPA: phenylalanine--tRNA ligase subunit alpha [candidate division CPR2 bacterium]|uniref:Phenylalanine--tRNA ligase alpha subunit n=1 Tax=candidate division CPR2 bacterium GW2011_GWC1_41_48 TaxID=1618344 RepID=A0A0G0WA79_UNCC2|nr:MAG: Phenylalanine-tRNA ligase alpha subunit [candidate division CPR2 bacterium GW2011_GWC2_39_35]KKR28607.1 MAG: Phenylalanine-tRNA ligase alpha subunit [candidate division CPR2 bacterium GW2011_GWD2_39_7]KKS08972.1 MAG: Phenylalanine-tRNA ligase alpha subunit [candidate division CPR2 bacterium GW2011_GWC1_41_48]OGB72921.1 MAG: phenylalanine--tRNA ligase subunit alpha [candidate division CPR2 bacterium GWD2_39_7]HBG81952.1 phenylalanine--tRNA ligase subunit alpha [candidate division CPR2 ba
MNNLNDILKEATEGIKKASLSSEVENFRVRYLGRKGRITLAMSSLATLPIDQRKEAGKELNKIKQEVESMIEKRLSEITSLKRENLADGEWIDVTAPGIKHTVGHQHLVTQTIKDMVEIFSKLGFSVAEGPEIETDWYNFEAVNMPKDHPVRDTQDTFFINENLVLRTQTTPVQIRVMQTEKPPIRVIVPGKTYRRDSDVTHTPMFHQLEGLVVDETVTLADLKGTLEAFVRAFFGEERKTRFRPHHFAFTEPSIEMDVSCGICGGGGCRVCKYSGWVEILGAGMVHPNVLKNGGIDPEKYQGFAFGFGIERPAMLRNNIDDLRLFFDNDLRFLEQF